MKCTNFVSSKLTKQTDVLFDGSSRAFSKIGTIAWISGFLITDPMTFNASAPDSWTFVCESPRTSINFGTMLGRHEDSCFGAQKAEKRKENLIKFLKNM